MFVRRLRESVDVNIVKSQVSLRSSPDKNNKLRLRSEQEAITHGLKNIQDNLQKNINNKNTSYILPSVYIEANRLDRIKMEPKYENFWSEPETQGNLDAIRSSLIDSLCINIYTDGSLSEESNQPGSVVMGCGWVAIGNDDSEFSFQGSVVDFPSSTRAELMAILTAFRCQCKNPQETQKLDASYAIKELIAVQDIHLQLVKVKAHSGIEHNELADKLAKDGTFQSKCIPNIPSLSSVNAVGQWRAKIIEVPLRGFVKKIGTSRHTAQWRLLNRHLDVMSNYKSQQVAWKTSWEVTSLSYKKRLSTCDKETRERAFNMKLLNRELPTRERMFERFPLVYKNNLCVRCNKETENHLHLFTCEKNLIDVEMCRDKFISLLVNQINVGATKSSCKDILSSINNLQEIKIIDSPLLRNPDEFSFADVLFGLVPLS
ncbi:hypothetical protein Glove_48g27 [Diversispora epigaea]|uniref:Uncharacterized protein n=1 Tax=Diversispora epigaea TaxID=1348612 RepID=A0A397JG98_9GLOM|nr:hypothetical protein Glove_48g27 [Diversispora epigaea]